MLNNNTPTNKVRVVVGMSGGVDSFAAAKLLVDAGYDVVGLTIKLHQYADDEASGCCTFNDIRDASLCCERLGIEHHVVPMLKPFKHAVIDKFLDSERSGVHINPCVTCNTDIKFPFFYQAAKSLGCDYIATGHYVKVVKLPDGTVTPGIGSTKDQSYFLWNVNREILANTLFPLGHFMSKDHVRELVSDVFARVSKKKDSTDLCFLNGKSRKEYLTEHGVEPRPSVGQKINGKYYLGVVNGSDSFAANSSDPQLFSDKIKCDAVTVHCTPDLFRKLLTEGDLYLVTRSSALEKHRVVHLDDLTSELTLDTPCKRTSPGQAAVIYSQRYSAVVAGGLVTE